MDQALYAIAAQKIRGIFVSPDLLLLANRTKIASTFRRTKLPAIFPLREYHDDGVLVSYGIDLHEAMRRAAPYVDKILKGMRPSDLPIEQVSKYELVIDMRVARELGINVPQELLLRADEVIRCFWNLLAATGTKSLSPRRRPVTRRRNGR